MLVAAFGCKSLTEVRFPVSPSALDYVQFVTHVPDTSGRAHTVRIELRGSGYLEYRAGTSERVRTGFWESPSAVSWEDLDERHVALSPADTLRILQRVVDAGLFDRGGSRDISVTRRPLFVQASIGREKQIRVTDEEVFYNIFRDLLRKFQF